jgi:hypothetical protein
LEGGAPVAIETSTLQRAAGPDRIKITNQGKTLSVVGGDFQAMLAAVKALPGRRFDGDTRLWEVPGELAIIKQLIETAGFSLEGADQILANSPVLPMAVPDFGPIDDEALAFEPPDFGNAGDAPPYEPPNWLDDDNGPPPQTEPPGWWEEPDDFAPPVEATDLTTAPLGTAPAPPAAGVSEKTSRSRQDRIRVRVGGIPFVVTGGEFRQMLGVIKQFPGRRFDGDDKVWDIPGELTIEGVKKKLAAVGFELVRD